MSDGSETRPSGVPVWIVGFVGFAAFLSGTVCGVLIDGNAEAVNDFHRRSPTSCPPHAAAPEVTEPRTQTSGRETSVHGNNAVDWSVTVPQGTPTGRIEMRNGDPVHGWSVSFANAADGTPAATLWIRPGSTARLSLPLGRWSVLPQRLGPDEAHDGVATLLDQAVAVDGSRTVVLAVPSDGRWRAIEPVPTRPKKARSRPVEGEYEGLGRGSEDGGTSTYGG